MGSLENSVLLITALGFNFRVCRVRDFRYLSDRPKSYWHFVRAQVLVYGFYPLEWYFVKVLEGSCKQPQSEGGLEWNQSQPHRHAVRPTIWSQNRWSRCLRDMSWSASSWHPRLPGSSSYFLLLTLVAGLKVISWPLSQPYALPFSSFPWLIWTFLGPYDRRPKSLRWTRILTLTLTTHHSLQR